MKTVKKSSQKLVSRVASRTVLRQNTKALKLYGEYKKTSDLIERAEVALGRKPAFKTETGSTLNFEINQHGVASTTAQTI